MITRRAAISAGLAAGLTSNTTPYSGPASGYSIDGELEPLDETMPDPTRGNRAKCREERTLLIR
jgi:hypothetical protein